MCNLDVCYVYYVNYIKLYIEIIIYRMGDKTSGWVSRGLR